MKCDFEKARWLGASIAMSMMTPFPLHANMAESYGTDRLAVEQQATKTVNGTVIEEGTNEPIIGATVIVKGTKLAVVTDLDGNFTINIPSGNKGITLEISSIGYAKTEVFTRGDEKLSIVLKSDDQMISEVVVVGAGTQKKVSVTGSIASVKGSVLSAPTSSLTTNFAGKLAGVMSRVSSGEPGQGSEFYIRGVSTFGGRSTPLILMDGIEISSGDLNRVPAESIESFSILKDASATAIYGARGANGVMLVTTKTGQENQKAKINVKLENSFVSPQNMVKYVDGARFMELYNEASIARGKDPVYSQEAIDLTRNGQYPQLYPDVDWQDMMFKEHTMNQRANINIQGGGSKVTYYMALQVNHDTGMLDIPKTYSFNNNINIWSYDFRNNLTYSVTPSTKVTMRMNAQFGNKKSPGSDNNHQVSALFGKAFKMPPVIFPAYYDAADGDKHIRFGNNFISGKDKYHNPYAEMLSQFQEDNYSTINASVDIDQRLDFLTKGLSIKVLANLKSWNNVAYTRTLDPYYYRLAVSREDIVARNGILTADDFEELYQGTDYINQSDAWRNSDQTIYIDARLNYERSFGLHNVSGMLMYMQREFRSGVLPNRNQGFSGRFTYDYDHRYLAEINFGYNGTERMASGQRFELFPAVSLGWVLSGEKFWKPIEKYIDFFKIRGSYGIVGSDETGEASGAPHFLYDHRIIIGGYQGFRQGYTPTDGTQGYKGPSFEAYAVDDAHWERVKKLDLGIDMDVLNQLNIAFDYFHEKRDRILMRRGSFPKQLGYNNAVPWSNIGIVINEGIDLSATWTKQFGKDLIVDARFNMTYNNNKYEYVDEPDYPYSWQTQTGKPLNMTKGYIAEGLFSSQEEIDNSPTQNLGSIPRPGDIKYRDVNGDGMINQEDQVMISPYGILPRLQYGIGINVTWKKWDFGVFFNASGKRTIMLNDLFPFCAGGYGWDEADRNVISYIDKNHWSIDNPNPNALYPRLGTKRDDVENNNQSSTFWMRNGSFVRFKTAEIGWSFKYGRIYVNADNIAVFSSFKEWDPELNWDSYPLNRTINAGLQLSF